MAKRPAAEASLGDDSRSSSSLSFLLHCADGIVPFLTPYLLRRCFPADQVKDVLLLGLAVRDTCVVPFFTSDSEKKREDKKPRGYTFSATTTPDSWLLPYHRVTVPAFDLLEDAQNLAPHDQSQYISVTNHHVHLWTTNGRHPLTLDLYQGSVRGLQSPVHVPLFDMIPPIVPAETNEDVVHAMIQQKRHRKRALTAITRTQTWTEECIGRAENDVWIPILIDPNSAATSNDNLIESQLDWMQQQDMKRVKGVAVIGWQHIEEATMRARELKTLFTKLSSVKTSGELSVAILATQSLRQVLEIASFDSNSERCKIVIGSNLPTTWAREKKAFVVNLGKDRKMAASTKKPRLEESTSSLQLDENGCIHLKGDDDQDVTKHPWFRDTAPLVDGCQCLTCQTHSRCYIYHLVCAKELLSEILLFIHNLHHMLELLRECNRSQAEERGSEFLDHVFSQLDSSPTS